MSAIEIVLLILILLLLSTLFYYDSLIKIVKKKQSKVRLANSKIVTFFRRIYSIFKTIRRFSLVYIIRNKFYRLYLAIAVAVVAIKIIVYYHPPIRQTLPLWLNKSTDFLIVSAAWEIICLITKTIEDKTNTK